MSDVNQKQNFQPRITPPKRLNQKQKTDLRIIDPDPGFVLSKRQRQMLEYVYIFGLLADRHLQCLENVSKRRSDELIYPLLKNGYVYRPNPKVRARYDNMFYWLSKKGAAEIAAGLNIAVKDLDWVRYPRWSQVEHDFMITDFRLIAQIACDAHPDFELVQWVNESSFRAWKDKVHYTTLAGNPGQRQIEIDGFGKIKRSFPDRSDQQPFFSRFMPEIELSPKDNPRFIDHKILPGLAYIRSEIYQKRFGSNSGRWLYIVEGEQKRENYRRATENAIPKEEWVLFYFATFSELSIDTFLFGDIWWRPGDDKPVPLFMLNPFA